MVTKRNALGRTVTEPGVFGGVCVTHFGGLFWGLLFAVVPSAIVLDSIYGLQLTQPMGQVLAPASLWWMLWLGAVALVFTLHGALARRPVLLKGRIAEAAPTFVGAIFLFWLWLHDAYVFLWPAAAFTGLYVCARVARWVLTETTAPLDWVAQDAASQPVAQAPIDLGQVQPAGTNQPPRAAASPASKFQALSSRRSFADVLGMEREKRALWELARDVGVGRRNGALLSGPPGAGKTFLVEALAGELGLPLITVSIARVSSMWVNATTENVVAAFDAAKEQSPCILFFDELDAVMGQRGGASNDGEGSKIVAAMLTELVAVRGRHVMVLAATNYPERLDAAGTREGRFDMKIEIALPDAGTRRKVLEEGIGREFATRIHAGVLEMAVEHFAGFNIARLSAIASQVRKHLKADRTGKGEVRFSSLLAVLRSIQGIDLKRRYDGVPALDEIVLAGDSRDRLSRLARQMGDIEATEREDKEAHLALGAVFYGPPGTGKTMTAKALAKQAQWSFIATTGHDLMRDDAAMEKVLERASHERPAIVFIDEADDILAERTMAPHTKMSTNKLLTLIDGEQGRIPDVFYIAATNHPEALDLAAVRRFPVKIAFNLPAARDIARYVQSWLGERDIPCSQDFKPGLAAQILSGRSMADIKEALREAVNIAVSERANNVNRQLRPSDLRRALRSLSFD